MDPDGYSIQVDDRSEPVAQNGAVTVHELAPGTHRVSLAGVAPNCALGGDNPRLATVVAGGTTPVRLAVTCVVPPAEPRVDFTIEPGFVAANDTTILTITVEPAPGDSLRAATLAFTAPGPPIINLPFFGDEPQQAIVWLIVPADPILATIGTTLTIDTKNHRVTRTGSLTVGERVAPALMWSDTVLVTASPGDSGLLRPWSVHDSSGVASVTVRSIGVVAYDSIFTPASAPQDFSHYLTLSVPLDAAVGDSVRVEAMVADVYGNTTTGVLLRLIVESASTLRVEGHSTVPDPVGSDVVTLGGASLRGAAPDWQISVRRGPITPPAHRRPATAPSPPSR